MLARGQVGIERPGSIRTNGGAAEQFAIRPYFHFRTGRARALEGEFAIRVGLLRQGEHGGDGSGAGYGERRRLPAQRRRFGEDLARGIHGAGRERVLASGQVGIERPGSIRGNGGAAEQFAIRPYFHFRTGCACALEGELAIRIGLLRQGEHRGNGGERGYLPAQRRRFSEHFARGIHGAGGERVLARGQVGIEGPGSIRANGGAAEQLAIRPYFHLRTGRACALERELTIRVGLLRQGEHGGDGSGAGYGERGCALRPGAAQQRDDDEQYDARDDGFGKIVSPRVGGMLYLSHDTLLLAASAPKPVL
ncbi:MAG: hypothetical protein BWY63_02442 [Chloroflexi bacterium ADurb.Bin360]|nr:MAG: hypothetical protein BWY63_02442 [Chloroflexi bacterium ADurb.Bin360]